MRTKWERGKGRWYRLFAIQNSGAIVISIDYAQRLPRKSELFVEIVKGEALRLKEARNGMLTFKKPISSYPDYDKKIPSVSMRDDYKLWYIPSLPTAYDAHEVDTW